MEKKSNSSGGAGSVVFSAVVLVAILAFIVWGFGPESYGEKATVWEYGHGEGTSRFATEEQINSFYKKVMAKPPNRRGGCQKYKKKLMRYIEGYEYESDAKWNKRYKQIIAREMREWRKKHGK